MGGLVIIAGTQQTAFHTVNLGIFCHPTPVMREQTESSRFWDGTMSYLLSQGLM